ATGEPGFHRGPLVGDGEVGEHGVAGVDVVEVAFHDLGLVPARAAAEVAPEGIDRLPPRVAHEPGRLSPVFVGRWRPGQGDTHRAYSRGVDTGLGARGR